MALSIQKAITPAMPSPRGIFTYHENMDVAAYTPNIRIIRAKPTHPIMVINFLDITGSFNLFPPCGLNQLDSEEQAEK